MANSKSNRGKKILTLILMIVSLNTIYVLPYLSYSYYTPLMEAMNLVGREADYGRLLNFYGIANVILYLPGGWVADKFDAKKLLVFSMISTGVLGLWEATFPSYEMLFVIYVMFAVTTVLTYWSSSIKCINMIADSDEQGGMFGMLEAGRGICGLAVTSLFVVLFSATGNMSMVVGSCGAIMILVGILLAVLMPKTSREGATNATLIDSLKAYGKAFKDPATYLLAGMIFCGSLIGASLSYFGPFLERICGVETNFVVAFQSYSKTICQIVAASLAAILSTKLGRSSLPMIYAGFGLVVACGILYILPSSASIMIPAILLIILITLGMSTFRALYYATIYESSCPKNTVGSIIGIASILGFLPDTFYTSMAGGWMDKYGDAGFKYVFLACIGAALLGLVCSFLSDRRIRKYRKSLDAAK